MGETITGHYIIKCLSCGAIIAQCRCPTVTKKRIEYDLCGSCRKVTKDPFEPQWSSIAATLRELLRRNAPFWGNQEAWRNLVFVIKNELSWIENALSTLPPQQKRMICREPAPGNHTLSVKGDG